MQLEGSTEPVFWWWEESNGARVVVLTADTLVLSSPLTKPQLADLESARQRGAILDADLGSHPQIADLGTVRSVRHRPDEHRVEVGLADAVAPILITPPAASAGVAAGVFEALHDIVAPARQTVETISVEVEDAPPRPVMWGLAALALVFTLGSIVVPMSLVPAGLCVVALGVLVLRDQSSDEPMLGGRVVEIPLGPDPVEAADLDSATDFDRPLLAPERTPDAEPDTASPISDMAPQAVPVVAVDEPEPAAVIPDPDPTPTTADPEPAAIIPDPEPEPDPTPTTADPEPAAIIPDPEPDVGPPPMPPAPPSVAPVTYDEHAPRPAWASAPEPSTDVATPAAVEASVGVTSPAPAAAPQPVSVAPDDQDVEAPLQPPVAPWGEPPA